MIPLEKTIITDEMTSAAADALASEDLLFGESVARFEEEFARYCGSAHAIAVGSGTEALTFCLMAIDVRKKHAIVPPSSYIATANVAFHAGGEPVFCDIGKTNDIDPHLAEGIMKRDRKAKAIIPVHLHGYPADMDSLMEMAERRGVHVIEDACQAHGALYKGKKAGSMGHAGCFSFNPYKNMTCGGEGGMVVTDDDKLAKRVRMLADSGRKSIYSHEHEIIGFSSRINTMNAAIGRVQLRNLEEWNGSRRRAAMEYRARLDGAEGIGLPVLEDGMSPAYNKFAIRCKRRNGLKGHLDANGIECDSHYPIPIHLQPPYKRLGYKRGDFPVAERFAKETLSLPMFPGITDEEIGKVCDAILAF